MLEYLYLLPNALLTSTPVYRPCPLVLMFIDFSIVIGSDSFCPYTSEHVTSCQLFIWLIPFSWNMVAWCLNPS